MGGRGQAGPGPGAGAGQGGAGNLLLPSSCYDAGFAAGGRGGPGEGQQEGGQKAEKTYEVYKTMASILKGW